MASRRIFVIPWDLLGLAGLSFIAGKLGLALIFAPGGAPALWPPTGVALAATLLLGYRVWPALFLGAFLVNVTSAGSVWTSLGIAAGDTLEGLLGVFLIARLANGRDVFNRVRDIFTFAILAGLLATAVSATVGVASLWIGRDATAERVGVIWLTWWLGHMAGALVVTPALVCWGMDRTLRLGRRAALELLALLGGVVLFGGAVFGGLGIPRVPSYPLEFLCIPLLVLAAFRFGQREAATCVVLLAVMATWGTLQGFGPFVRATENPSLVLLQAFMATIAMMTLPLAAVVRERGRAEAARAHAAAIVESSDDAIIGKTLDGIITSWNRGAERLYGYSAREVVGRWPIAIIIPLAQRDELSMILERMERGERVDHYETGYETVQVAKDGRLIDVSVTVSPIRDAEGKIVGVSSIARDITHRKQVEAAIRERDALRYVASLAAAATHEINNPLTVVVGHAQLLADEVDAAGRQRIDEILEATQRIQEIVLRLTHINRLELMDEARSVPEMLDLDKSSREG